MTTLELTMYPPRRNDDEDAALLKVLQKHTGDRTDEVQALERMLETKPGET